MHIESVTISGFRCFGPVPVIMDFAREITALVGPNAAGKTALLHALSKVFGVSRTQRTVFRSDFHVAPGTDAESRDPKELYIEVLVALPELADGSATSETVAPSFRHTQLARVGAVPVCRLRLEARWENDGTAEGEVSQELYWVDTLEPQPTDTHKAIVRAAERGLIQLHYTPASRNASAQVRATTGALAARLLRAIEWSEAAQLSVGEVTQALAGTFEAEAAIAAIREVLRARWSDLHDEETDVAPRLSLVSRRFEEVVSRISVAFEQGPDGRERGLEALSDGQQSLFYFALAAAVFDLERAVVGGTADGFRPEQLHVPALTILAFEEPENHLSPYFLARIVRQTRSLTATGRAQAVVTSHSPSVLGRIEPREVRHCRRDPATGTSRVTSVPLPSGPVDEVKFVRGALLAHPELYFARFVLLVEGDSERILIPRIAEAMSILIDPAFVAIVPLGGRHVQHFWRLLGGLKIPYATLLDLDLGREGGGFGRVKTALIRLLEVGVPREQLLLLSDGSVMDQSQLGAMHKRQTAADLADMKAWVDRLSDFGVFFSTPLDVDLMMLRAFPAAYAALEPPGGGPRTSPAKAAEAVLGTAGPGLTVHPASSAYPPLLPAYCYHFLTRSKPATHLEALAHIDLVDLEARAPRRLKTVLRYIQSKLSGV